LVYSIIEEHHGSIAVSSPLANSDHGTCFTLRLPKQAASLP
jgi:signal transduction histidine kinase